MPAKLLTPEEMRAFRDHWQPPTAAPIPQAIPPAPAPAAPPTAPPARQAARPPIYLDAMTPDELSSFYAEFGYELGDAPAPNTMQRPWNNPDPRARRERLRKAQMNEIAIAQMRREKAAVESARIAKLEAARMTREKTLAASSDELRAQADKQGLGGSGGLSEGIEIREPWRPLPPPRPSLTIRDQQEAARRLRRQEANQPPPQLGSDAYSQELAAAGMADATVVVAAAPQPPQPTPAAPQPHVTKASKLSATAFADLLRKKFGM